MSGMTFDDSRIVSRLNDLQATTNGLRNEMNYMRNEMGSMNETISQVSEELANLAEEFHKMMEEQQRTAALQQATTELVRIRQELEQNYGGYMVVRETMLGVLQATDSALVKKTTIARVSEELMISTPEYWLAPCLVAVSAWISNNRELAERAIVEAVKRDEERTALTMALICRRNNRIDTCYEWLSIYFAKQKATQISESSYAYIDAYVNGIFGPDEKHMCDDYIARWIEEIRGNNEAFESEQEELWKQYYESFRCTVSGQYPALKESVNEFNQIDEYIGRVQAIDVVKSNFDQIANAEVDQEYLKAMVDKRLIELITRYDEKEAPLRKEEELQMAVKKFNGDVTKAREYVARRTERRKENRLNLIEQMTNVIKTDNNEMPSKRKTAVSFLRGYINKGFEAYASQDKEKFPTSITMNVNGWIGTTTDGSNCNELYQSYGAYLNSGYNYEMQHATSKNANIAMIAGISCAVLALIFLIVFIPVGLLFGIGSVASFVMMVKVKSDMKNNVSAICDKYNNLTQQGNKQIQDCLEQWNQARSIANDFAAKPIQNLVA